MDAIAMETRIVLLNALLVIAVVAGTASAFTSETLVIDVSDNGNTNVAFDYRLSFPEKLAFYIIPAKEEIVKSAIESKFKKVTVSDVTISAERCDLTLNNFASVSQSGTGTRYRTPAVSFLIARDMLDSYQEISYILKPDFSPDTTLVRFPGGTEYTYKDVTGIPSLTAVTAI